MTKPKKRKKPQNRSPEAKRKADGTFKKGTSGNPGGRPVEERDLVTKLRALCGDDLVAEIRFQVFRAHDVTALKILLDRAYGKARQVVTLEGGEKPVELNLAALSTEEIRVWRELAAKAETQKAAQPEVTSNG